MAGLRAVKNILFEATKVPTILEYKQYYKQGGFKRAVEDFESINFQNVEILRSKSEVKLLSYFGHRMLFFCQVL